MNEIKAFNNIKIIGIGGGGNNTIDVIKNSKYGDKVNTYALNTDEQALKKSNADHTLAIGKKLTKGLGAGSKPNVGQDAAIESMEEIKAILEDTDLLFITAGMGGGTGTGAAAEVARIAHELGILTIAIITLPFNFEGYMRLNYAIEGARRIQKQADVTLVISNQVLVNKYPNAYVEDAFALPDKAIESSIIVLLELLSNNGGSFGKGYTINDLPEFFENAGIALTTIGKSDPNITDSRALLDALGKAISSDILQLSIKGATKFIIKVDIASSLEPTLELLLQGTTQALYKFLKYDEEWIERSNVQVVPTIHESDDFVGAEVKIIATGFDNPDLVFEKMLTRATDDMHDAMVFGIDK